MRIKQKDITRRRTALPRLTLQQQLTPQQQQQQTHPSHPFEWKARTELHVDSEIVLKNRTVDRTSTLHSSPN